jgi:nucleotide-binding universal stress UspA family protein
MQLQSRQVDMQKIGRILLAVDGNHYRQALMAEVATVAKDAGARVTLLSVLNMPTDDEESTRESFDLRRWMTEEKLEQMKEISSEFVIKGIQVTIQQATGKPWLEILREALKGDYDLIMKPAEREAGIKNMLFGGTDMQLFRMCPCPVWVFKPTHNTELRKILIAVDLLAYDREKSALADNVLQWGKHVADLVDAELHVVHVWDLYGEATIRGRSILADTADKLVQGEAKKLIPEIANAMETDLLVMGTVGRTGIPGFFIGNTADSVLRQVDCSVLAIKPEGFVTPVKVD